MNATAKRLHWAKVKAYCCWTCGGFPTDPHHGIGQSLTERGFGPGKAVKRSDYLVFPLCRKCHDELHAGYETWETKHGRTQAEMLDEFCKRIGMALWALAANDKPETRKYKRSSKLLAPREAL